MGDILVGKFVCVLLGRCWSRWCWHIPLGESGRTQDPRLSSGFEGRFQALMRAGSNAVRFSHGCVLHIVGISVFLLRTNISSSQRGQPLLSGNMHSTCYSHAAQWSLLGQLHLSSVRVAGGFVMKGSCGKQSHPTLPLSLTWTGHQWPGLSALIRLCSPGPKHRVFSEASKASRQASGGTVLRFFTVIDCHSKISATSVKWSVSRLWPLA